MDILEVLKTLAVFAGSITTIFGCLLLFIKPIRTWVSNGIKKNTEDKEQKELIMRMNETLEKHMEQYDLQNEALLSMLRDNITKTYYKFISIGEIPCYERENLVKQYCIYHKMNGNSYIDIIYEELLELNVKK
jgi:hypothetical protein